MSQVGVPRPLRMQPNRRPAIDAARIVSSLSVGGMRPEVPRAPLGVEGDPVIAGEPIKGAPRRRGSPNLITHHHRVSKANAKAQSRSAGKTNLSVVRRGKPSGGQRMVLMALTSGRHPNIDVREINCMMTQLFRRNQPGRLEATRGSFTRFFFCAPPAAVPAKP